MKNLFKILFVALLAMGIAACSKEVNEGPTVSSGDRVWMSFKISLPTTRSATDENQGETNSNAKLDYEPGQAKENTVSTVQLLLLKNDVVIAKSADALPAGAGTTYTVPFQSEDLIAAAADGDEETDINVIVYCNHTTSASKDAQLSTIKEEVAGLTDLTALKAIWADNHFWMTNANKVDWECKLPGKNALQANYKTPADAYDIGAIKVERTAARFDFAQNYTEFEIAGNTGIKVKLDKIALFNMSKDCYKLRRVSENGKKANWDLFGIEGMENYVVDTDGEAKAACWLDGGEGGDLVWKNIAGLGFEDLWDDQEDAHANLDPKPDYHFFEYAVENTIAGTDQHQKDATGISFEGHIDAEAQGADPLIKAAMTAGRPIYVYGNNLLLGDWDRVKAVAKGETIGEQQYTQDPAVEVAYDYIMSIRSDQSAAECKADETELASAFLKVYKPTEGEYKVYYNYYNRHNDNDDPKHMGPMEFAVVRNNVYKIKVNAIGAFGTPEWEKPKDEPIEKDETYFKVEVKVLPWVVRVNDIVLE